MFSTVVLIIQRLFTTHWLPAVADKKWGLGGVFKAIFTWYTYISDRTAMESRSIPERQQGEGERIE